MDEPTAQEVPQTVEERMAAHLKAQQPELAEQEAEQSVEQVEDSAPVAEEEPAEEALPEAVATDGDGEDEITVSSLAELMENVGADVDSMYDLTFPVTINGKREDVPLSEVKDSYRATQDALRYQEEAKAAREQARAASETAEEKARLQLAQANKLAEGLDQMYLAPFQHVDWNTLRAEDPAEYAAKRQEYVDTQNAVAAQKQAVLNEIEQFKQRTEAEQAGAMQEVLARERDALHNKWPEMADPEKGDAERSAIVGFLKTEGFGDDEIGQVSDHRVLLMVRDAMRYREQAQQAGAARKKVIKIGKKVVTPGAAQTKADRAQDSERGLRTQLRKSGRIEDAAALLSQRLNR